MALDPTDRLLTAAQAMQRLAVSRDKIYDLLRRGEIHSLKIGRSRRIPSSAVETYLQRQLDAGYRDGAA